MFQEVWTGKKQKVIDVNLKSQNAENQLKEKEKQYKTKINEQDNAISTFKKELVEIDSVIKSLSAVSRQLSIQPVVRSGMVKLTAPKLISKLTKKTETSNLIVIYVINLLMQTITWQITKKVKTITAQRILKNNMIYDLSNT